MSDAGDIKKVEQKTGRPEAEENIWEQILNEYRKCFTRSAKKKTDAVYRVLTLRGEHGEYNDIYTYDAEKDEFFLESPDDNYYHWGAYDKCSWERSRFSTEDQERADAYRKKYFLSKKTRRAEEWVAIEGEAAECEDIEDFLRDIRSLNIASGEQVDVFREEEYQCLFVTELIENKPWGVIEGVYIEKKKTPCYLVACYGGDMAEGGRILRKNVLSLGKVIALAREEGITYGDILEAAEENGINTGAWEQYNSEEKPIIAKISAPAEKDNKPEISLPTPKADTNDNSLPSKNAGTPEISLPTKKDGKTETPSPAWKAAGLASSAKEQIDKTEKKAVPHASEVFKAFLKLFLEKLAMAGISIITLLIVIILMTKCTAGQAGTKARPTDKPFDHFPTIELKVPDITPITIPDSIKLDKIPDLEPILPENFMEEAADGEH